MCIRDRLYVVGGQSHGFRRSVSHAIKPVCINSSFTVTWIIKLCTSQLFPYPRHFQSELSLTQSHSIPYYSLTTLYVNPNQQDLARGVGTLTHHETEGHGLSLSLIHLHTTCHDTHISSDWWINSTANVPWIPPHIIARIHYSFSFDRTPLQSNRYCSWGVMSYAT